MLINETSSVGPSPLAKIKSTLGDEVEEGQEQFRRKAYTLQTQLEANDLVRPSHKARKDVLLRLEGLQREDADAALQRLGCETTTTTSTSSASNSTPIRGLLELSMLDLSILMYVDTSKPLPTTSSPSSTGTLLHRNMEDSCETQLAAMGAFAGSYGTPALGRALRGALFSTERREGIIAFITGVAQLLQNRSFFEEFVTSSSGNIGQKTVADIKSDLEFILGVHRWVCDAAVSLLPLVVQQYEASSEATRLLHGVEEVLRIMSPPFLADFRRGLVWLVEQATTTAITEQSTTSITDVTTLTPEETATHIIETTLAPYFVTPPGYRNVSPRESSNDKMMSYYFDVSFYKSHMQSGGLLTPPLIQCRRLTSKDLSGLALAYAQVYDAPKHMAPVCTQQQQNREISKLPATLSCHARTLGGLSFDFESESVGNNSQSSCSGRIGRGAGVGQPLSTLDYTTISNLKVLESEVVRRYKLAFTPYIPPSSQQLRSLEDKQQSHQRFSTGAHLQAHRKEYERIKQRSLLTLTDISDLCTAFAVMRFSGTLSTLPHQQSIHRGSGRMVVNGDLEYGSNFWDATTTYVKSFIVRDFEMYVKMWTEESQAATASTGSTAERDVLVGDSDVDEDEGSDEYLPVTFSRSELRSICFALCRVQRTDLYDSIMDFLSTDVDELLAGKGSVLKGKRILPNPVVAPPVQCVGGGDEFISQHAPAAITQRSKYSGGRIKDDDGDDEEDVQRN
jgi:hypothetical protein